MARIYSALCSALLLISLVACGDVETFVDGGVDGADVLIDAADPVTVDAAEPAVDAAPGIDAAIDAAPGTDAPMAGPPDTILSSTPPAVAASASATFVFRSDTPGSTFECELDSGGYQPCTSPRSLSGLADGSRRFAVRAIGAGGADPSPALYAWIIDTVAPVVTITAGPTAAVDDTTPTFSFSVTGNATAIECAIDTGGFAACTSPYTTIGLAQGAHTVHVRARDAAGNQSAVASRSFTVDTIAPTVNITAGPAEDELWLDDRVTLSFAATDATALTRECRIYRVGTIAPAYAACSSPVTYDLGGGSNIVEYRFQVRATDAAANATTVTRTFRQAVPAG